MKKHLALLGIWILALSSCNSVFDAVPAHPIDTPVGQTTTVTVTPTNSTTVIMSDCFISFKLAAWHDLNGDGVWDISEPPLKDVQFNLQGLFAEKWGPEPDSNKGDGWYSILIWSPGDCIEQEYTITAVPPESYEATTPSVVTFSNPLPFEAQFGFRAISK